MKDMLEITNNDLSKLIKTADENNIVYDCFEGSLQDNFIFYNNNVINIGWGSAKYIIVKERFLNEWSSDLVLIMTDSDEEVEEFKSNFDS
jgi:hypothetical protein